MSCLFQGVPHGWRLADELAAGLAKPMRRLVKTLPKQNFGAYDSHHFIFQAGMLMEKGFFRQGGPWLKTEAAAPRLSWAGTGMARSR